MERVHRRGHGPPLDGVVRDLGRAGDGVVVTAEGLVFVPGVAPGERVEIELLGRRRGVLRGRLRRIVAPSPARVDVPCALASRCGGCPLMHMEGAAQRDHKRRMVASAVSLPAVMEDAGTPLRYRRRARLGFDRRGGARTLGYRPRTSHGVVDVPHCAVLSEVVSSGLDSVRRGLLDALVGEGAVHVAEGAGSAAAIVVESELPQPPCVYGASEALALQARVAGVALRVGGASVPAVFGDPREHAVAADGAPLVGALTGFSQAHDEVSRALARRVLQLAGARAAEVLELYAGRGTLTVVLAARAAHVTAVERSPEAARACRENLLARGLDSVTVVTADAQSRAAGPSVDVVVLDPPRTGARAVLSGVASRRPARIIYVSCDPPTLERDLRGLRRLGYVPDATYAFDMFPQTAHVEAVVRLVPRG